jgi:1,4-dihydroxy-2-naphthoate octaprenyltransferase
MDTLQARFRDKASEMIQNSPTIAVALGRGRSFTIETCYAVGDSEELYCIVKPNPALVEAVGDDACVAFAVNRGFPNQQLQGTGRAFFLGGLDLHPQIRDLVLAKAPEAMTFLSTIRNLGVLKILPDQMAVTDDANLGLGPRPVYVPEAARTLPSRRRRWIQAVGLMSWPLVLIPVLVAALLADDAAVEVVWWLLLPVSLVALSLSTGTVLLATYSGFRRQRARSPALGSSLLLQQGLLPVQQVRWAGVFALGSGVLLGVFLVGLRGLPLLSIGLISVAAGLLYAGWPLYLARREFEEGLVFACLGPLAVLGTYVALTGVGSARAFLISLPFGLLAASLLLAHHLASFPEDVQARHATLPVALGWDRARLLFALLAGLPYALVLILLLVGTLPGWAWLVYVSVPLAGRGIWAVWQASAAETAHLGTLDRQMGYAYLAFSVLLGLGLLLG